MGMTTVNVVIKSIMSIRVITAIGLLIRSIVSTIIVQVGLAFNIAALSPYLPAIQGLNRSLAVVQRFAIRVYHRSQFCPLVL